MPRNRSSSTLEVLLSDIVQRMVREIAGAIREARASSTVAAVKPAAPAPKKKPASKVRKAPAKRATPKRATAGADPIQKVLGVIRAEPDLRSEQIERLAELPKAAVQTALAALRKDGRVKVQGKARGTTYAAT